MKLTVLVENTTSHGRLLAEFGWSVLIEDDMGSSLLFDTGGGHTIEHNAKILGKDLSKLEAIILSHHHYDHTDGLAQVLKHTGSIPVYTHPHLFKESYSDGGFIGQKHSQAYLESLGAHFIFSDSFKEIHPDFYLSGEIEKTTDFEKGDTSLVIKGGELLVQDQLKDDQYLVIKTPEGLVLILGCAHTGLINTLNHVIKNTGEKRIRYLIGGTHLGPASKEQREKTYEALKDFEIENIGVSHCTGGEAAYELKKIYGDKFFNCNVGKEIKI